VRHLDVEHDCIGRELIELGEGTAAITRHATDLNVRVAGQRIGQQTPNDGGVIDKHDSQGCGAHTWAVVMPVVKIDLQVSAT
jgi:hypothetical protein